MNHMNMKSALTLGLAFTVSMFGSLGAAPKAYAQIQTQISPPWTSHPGTVCKASNPNQALDYSPWGDVENEQLYEIWVTCPLMRAKQENDKGAHIEVYVTHIGSQHTFCKAYSHGYNGTSLAFAQEGWTGSGDGKVILDLAYKNGASNYLSFYVVNCQIPGKDKGRLKSILLKESV